MKKKNNKGFMLAETMIVSVFVLTTLVVVYAQFRMINSSYNYTFKYNTVNSLYLTDGIRNYLQENILPSLISELKNNDQKYIDITNCSETYLGNKNYCQNLFKVSEVKQIIITDDNLDQLKQKLDEIRYLDENMIDFIKTVKYEGLSDTYRIIVLFEDSTYASIKLGGE